MITFKPNAFLSPPVVGVASGGDDPPPTWWGGGGTPVGRVARIRDAAPTLAIVLPGLSPAALQILLGQVEAESQFGDAFKTPDGSRSHNWGALYAMGDRGTIPVNDTNDGKPMKGKAAWNSSAVVGARQFVNLIAKAYAPALERAAAGDAWGYARALWRDGPGSSRPSYYGGFPPGDKRGLTPAGVPLHSALDHYWRVTAYARMVHGAARSAASALGQPFAVQLVEPAPPGGLTGASPSSPSSPAAPAADDGGGGLLALGLASTVAFALWQGLAK